MVLSSTQDVSTTQFARRSTGGMYDTGSGTRHVARSTFRQTPSPSKSPHHVALILPGFMPDQDSVVSLRTSNQIQSQPFAVR